MNVNQLRTLLAVVEAQSFRAAGERIGLSPSAVSLQIKAMEEELGVQLFDRISRPAVPTARARALAAHARRTLDLFDASAAVARGERVRARLVIGAVPTVLASFLPSGLKQLQRSFSELKIDVQSGGSAALASALGEGRLDVAVCTRPPAPIPGLDWHSVAMEPFCVVAPAHAEGDTDVDLISRHPFIWFNRKTWAGRGIEEELRARKIDVNATMEIDSLEAISNLVGEGLGVSIVPLCKGRRPFSARLRSVPFGTPPFQREVGVLTARDGRNDLVIDRLVHALAS